MGFELTRLRRLARLAALLGALGPATASIAQPAAPSGTRIISCVDAGGKPIKTDKLSDCKAKATDLRPDGSVRGEIPPPLSPDELAAQQECERKNAEVASEQRERIRRDRLLLNKFSTEAKHQQAREKALDDVRKSVGQSEERIRQLTKDRKPLLDEAEFYRKQPLPPLLKQQLDSSDALLTAQKVLAQNQQEEASRINTSFDEQLRYLRKLWANGPAAAAAPLPCGAVAIRKDR